MHITLEQNFNFFTTQTLMIDMALKLIFVISGSALNSINFNKNFQVNTIVAILTSYSASHLDPPSKVEFSYPVQLKQIDQDSTSKHPKLHFQLLPKFLSFSNKRSKSHKSAYSMGRNHVSVVLHRGIAIGKNAVSEENIIEILLGNTKIILTLANLC